jgi:starvation-inducible outer membrane lipoprotein
MRKNWTTILAAIALTACSSVTDLQRKGPDGTFTSARSVQSVSACVSQAWQSHNKAVNATPLENGTRINMIYPEYMTPIGFVDVSASGTGSKILYYKGDGFTSWAKDDVVHCL